MATESGDRPALAAAHGARRLVCAGPEGLPEREVLAERMLTLAHGVNDPRLELSARLWQI
jgi:hypothetical protein